MTYPHTSAPRGKLVRAHLRDGGVIEGKFVERTGKFVVLENCRIPAGLIRKFYIVNPSLRTTMYFIAVYNDNEDLIGYVDAQGKLTESKDQAADFSSKKTAQDLCGQLERESNGNDPWYCELEER